MPRIVALVVIAMLATFAATPAHAFRSTSSESYTDPDFKGFQPKRIMLVVDDNDSDMRLQVESRVIAAMKKSGVEVVPMRELMPPTREWTVEAQGAVLTQAAIDSVLVITVGASSRVVMPIMTQTRTTTTASATGYGNSVYGSANSTSSTVPVYGAKSKSIFSAVLKDTATGRIAWYADITVKASGTYFVSDKSDAKGVAGEVAKAMQSDGHLPK